MILLVYVNTSTQNIYDIQIKQNAFSVYLTCIAMNFFLPRVKLLPITIYKNPLNTEEYKKLWI